MIEAILTALSFNLQRFWRLYAFLIIAAIIVLLGAYAELLAAPADFPAGQTIVIPRAAPLPAIAALLAADHVIKNPLLFEVVVRLAGGANRLEAGPYLLARPIGVLQVVDRVLSGTSGIPEVRITFIEGESVRTMAVVIAKKFAGISASDFIAVAGGYEGYLFPDTYNFSPAATPEQIVATMRATFNAKTASLAPAIAASGHSLSDIVIMASIVEKEGSTPDNRRVIAGILWNRLKKGIALQVDAPFGYLQGRDEYSPSLVDLSIDSPYNTYEHKGLPPGPIGNPGLDALTAAAEPTQSNYLYYLSGRDGQMHYAVTYAQHQANEKKYLR